MRCSKCSNTKPLTEEFWYFDKSGPRIGMPKTLCRACKEEQRKKTKERDNKRSNDWYSANKARHRQKSREWWYANKYSIPILLTEIPDSCEVCGSTNTVCVDHCHMTETVRGFLCRRCNSTLGFVQDDPNLLEQLAKYLRRTSK